MATQFEFTGITTALAGEFVLSRGITPSICTLFIAPKALVNLAPGVLTVRDGSRAISFSGCAVDQANFRMRLDGTHWREALQILDRRRLWKSGSISGEYNVRLSNGSVVESTRKSAAELMGLCLAACGESGASVAQAPQNVYPYVRWRDARSDLALAALCNYTACEVCPTNSDTFAIYPLGVGVDLPTIDGQRHMPIRYVPRSVPAIIRVVCGPSVWQTKLVLRSIAENSSGSQFTTSTVSYKPSTGFIYESPFTFPNESGASQRAALESIYKRFRVTSQADGSLTVPACNEAISKVSQYFPIQEYLLESAADLDATPRSLRAHIEGDFWPYSQSSESANNIRYVGEFKLRGDRGEVEMPAPVFGLSSGTILDPTLYLAASYSVTGSDGDFVRVRRDASVLGGSGVEILRRPELFASYTANYSTSSPTQTTGVTSTRHDAEDEADRYLALFSQKYSDTTAGECTYHGLLNCGLDGKIAQLFWRASVNGKPTTQVCLNEELCVYAPSRREKKRREKLEGL